MTQRRQNTSGGRTMVWGTYLRWFMNKIPDYEDPQMPENMPWFFLLLLSYYIIFFFTVRVNGFSMLLGIFTYSTSIDKWPPCNWLPRYDRWSCFAIAMLLAGSKEIKSRVYMNFILLYISIFRILLSYRESSMPLHVLAGACHLATCLAHNVQLFQSGLSYTLPRELGCRSFVLSQHPSLPSILTRQGYSLPYHNNRYRVKYFMVL